jgi:DNA gyrase subunit B
MGKLMNSLKSKPDAIKKNKRAEDLIEAFGIGLGNSRYEKIIAATDADLDGTHIKTLMIAMFYVLDRKVLEEQRFYQLNTPVMVITDKNDNLIKWYYTLSEYQEDQPNIKPGYTHMYIKGLGSLSSKNLKKIIEKDGIEKMIEPIVFDVEKDGKIIERWMTDEGIDYRKMVLEQKSFDISNI